MKHLLRIGCFVLLLYLGFVTYVAANQDRYLYNASHESESAMLSEAAVRGLLPLRNVQGEITGWHLQNPSATRRLLVFHGGSGYALSREFYARAFEQLGWDVSLFEYPGFGARSGKPGRESFLAAGRDFLRDRAAEDRRPLYLLGESMEAAPSAGSPGKVATSSPASHWSFRTPGSPRWQSGACRCSPSISSFAMLMTIPPLSNPTADLSR